MKQVKSLLHYKVEELDTDLENIKYRAVNIVFVTAIIDEIGYYRTILPFFELNKQQDFHIRMLDVRLLDFNNTYRLDIQDIEVTLLQWAHIIVFPCLIEDHTYVFKAIRALNPQVEFIMDIPTMLHDLSDDHPEWHKIGTKEQDNLIRNMLQMHSITSHSCSILERYYVLLEKQTPDHLVTFHRLPNLISKIGFEGLRLNGDKQNSSLRIGMLSSIHQIDDILMIKEALYRIQNEYPQKITFVVLGMGEKQASLQDLSIVYEKSVSFLNYYKKLLELDLDLVVLPKKKSASSAYDMITKYLELSALKIPVIASKDSVYAKVIKEGCNGLLAHNNNQWYVQIKRLIEDRTLRLKLAQKAHRYVYKYHSYQEKNITPFKEVFL